MKKIIVTLAVVVSAALANAAAFSWSAAQIYSPADSTALLNAGTASLYCDALSSSALSTASVSGGKIAATTFSSEAAVANTSYDFYFVLETEQGGSSYSFTSATKAVTASATGTAGISFGTQKAATTDSSNWKGGSSDVPEPTSGLLLLVGLAGLALRRKQA